MEIKMKYVCNEPFWKFKKLDGNNSYCKVCKKNVVDFRDFSETELLNYKIQNPEVICGIFTSEQADVDVNTVYGAAVYKIVLASFISFFTFSFVESEAQSMKDSLKTEQYPVVKSDTIQVESKKEDSTEYLSNNDCKTYSKSFLKKHGMTIFRIGSFKMVTKFPFIIKERAYGGHLIW